MLQGMNPGVEEYKSSGSDSSSALTAFSALPHGASSGGFIEDARHLPPGVL
jgi:hypothetical protein